MKSIRRTILLKLLLILILFNFVNAQKTPRILSIDTYLPVNGVAKGAVFQAAVVVDIIDTWHINSNKPLDEFAVATDIIIEESEGIKIDKISFPRHEVKKMMGMNIALFDGKTVINISGKFSKSIENRGVIKGKLVYQACNDRTCLAPDEESFSIDIPVLPESQIVKNTDNADLFPDITMEESGKVLSFLTIIKFLLMAFVGGIILNVMPCVLPVLSIKAMSIVKQSQQDKKMIMKSSFVYTAGILVSFLILALIIVILKMSGELVGWGFQFQSAGFVIFLLTVIFVFALSLFDVFIIRAPGVQAASQLSAKSGMTGSFLSGIFAVLLATPCTAPILGAALGFAFSQPPVMIFAIFIVVGLGLAFPFILLGFWPRAIKLIPKPGQWMNLFKEFMGFLLIGTALFLLRTVYFLVGGENTIMVLWFLVFIGIAAWVYGRFGGPEHSLKKQWIFTILAIVIAISAGVYTLDFKENIADSEQSALHYGWQKFSPELVEELRTAGTPVFIDFSAEWCLTCKTNEKTVLHTDEISSAFKKYNVTLLYGDNTKKDEIIGQWLRKFNRAGVPLYIFYIPGQEEPVVLPELITKKMVLKMLEQLNK